MKILRHNGSLWRAAVVALMASLAIAAFAQQTAQNDANTEKPVLLDHVIAIINGEVLLESDVQLELRLAALQPFSAPAAQNTPLRAAQRLISRALILQQMQALEQNSYTATDEQVQQGLAEVRGTIPACIQLHCTTEEGWHAFLQANHLTEQEAEERWRQRLEILHFIDLRFGAGIRIPRSQIQEYYQKNLVPEFDKIKKPPPSLDSVEPRIREILLQQQVNGLLRDWLQSLRQQGSVQILDSAYGQSTGGDDDSGGGA